MPQLAAKVPGNPARHWTCVGIAATIDASTPSPTNNFRNAMSRLAAAVNVITTDGLPGGMA